jgi:hypothetical protein
MKLHAVHLAQFPEAYHTIASTINFACRPSRSLWVVRRLFRGLRCARPCPSTALGTSPLLASPPAKFSPALWA